MAIAHDSGLSPQEMTQLAQRKQAKESHPPISCPACDAPVRTAIGSSSSLVCSACNVEFCIRHGTPPPGTPIPLSPFPALLNSSHAATQSRTLVGRPGTCGPPMPTTPGRMVANCPDNSLALAPHTRLPRVPRTDPEGKPESPMNDVARSPGAPRGYSWRLPIQNGGCNHMTCRCGHEICWLCGKDYNKASARALRALGNQCANGHWRK
jgi:hypothetical protein